MIDKEKVMDALDCLSHGGGTYDCLKFPCPYGFYGYTDCHKWEIARDAIALLKEQEAKLLTFEEVKNHFHVPIKLLGDIEKYVDFENDIEPLYFECDIEDAWTVHWRTYVNTKEYLESWEKDYGKTWRCWTKKPTEEQKRTVKWK